MPLLAAEAVKLLEIDYFLLVDFDEREKGRKGKSGCYPILPPHFVEWRSLRESLVLFIVHGCLACAVITADCPILLLIRASHFVIVGHGHDSDSSHFVDGCISKVDTRLARSTSTKGPRV
jgi:hypothetical protein